MIQEEVRNLFFCLMGTQNYIQYFDQLKESIKNQKELWFDWWKNPECRKIA
jgi:hypothetical protein